MADKSPGASLIPLPIRPSKKRASGTSPTSVQTIQKIYEEDRDEGPETDKVELRKQSSFRSRITRSEYAKLQRKSSASGDRIEKLKEQYQTRRPKSAGNLHIGREVNIDRAIVEADKVTELKKQTSAGAESPKTEKKVSFTDVLVNRAEPVARPRKSLENRRRIAEFERDNPFIVGGEADGSAATVPKSPPRQDAQPKEVRVVKVQFDSIQYAEPEPRHIIVRQESVDSLNLIQQTLDNFEMDDKKMGRRGSFRGIRNFFTSKTKKKEEEAKAKKNQNAIVGENYENENFTRGSPMRHTADAAHRLKYQAHNNVSQAEIDNNFAEMHLQKYAEVKKRFANGVGPPKPPAEYACMDSASNYAERAPSHNGSYISDITKNHDTCSSNTDSETTSGTYENALIAQAEMMQRQHHGADRRQKPAPPQRDYSTRNKHQPDRSLDRRTDTPPRALDTYQHIELIKPRASIPISSERPLPNPYANTSEESLPTNKTIERNLSNALPHKFSPAAHAKDVLVNDIYGTVYDAKPTSPTNFGHKSPAKLRLPANREKVELVPRMKSPIPPAVVSADRIIATELLKNRGGKEDKAHVSTHQNLSIEIDYPPAENYRNDTGNSSTATPSPRLNSIRQQMSPLPLPQKVQNNIVRRTEMTPTADSASTPSSHATATRNVLADVHQASYRQMSPYYSPMALQDRRSSLSLSPSKRFSPAPLARSPSKQEIRQSVEAFCFKEIKKLKDRQEEQMYGYVLDPGRASRSMGMSSERGRRSLSLPREMPKARRNLDMYQHQNSLQMPMQQEPAYGATANGQYFVRNSPQRRTIESMHKSSGQLYTGPTTKPIFNRGSLLQQHQPINNLNNIDYNKKVSFDNSQTIQQSWPTKNGYVQSPPQRRMGTIQRLESMEDDVFVPVQMNNVSRPPAASNQHHHLEHQRRVYEQHLQQQQQQLHQDAIYGRLGHQQQQQPIRRLTLEEMHYLKQQQINQEPIYGRRQVAESLYGRTQAPVAFDPQYGSSLPRRPPQEQVHGVRYGTPVPQTATDASVRLARPILPPPVTAGQSYVRQVRVNNKECDIYGQIHEQNQQALRGAHVHQSGVMFGQLQRNANAGPMQHQSYNQLMGGQQNFVRNSRLTASANDMYRNVGPQYQQQQRTRNNDVILHEEPHYGQQQQQYRQQPTTYYDPSSGAPMRPLPPVPNNHHQPDPKNSIRTVLHRAESMSERERIYNSQQQDVSTKKSNSKKTKTKSGK